MALIPPISNSLARTISASLSSNDSRLLQIIRPLAKCDASEQEQYRHHGYGYVLWIVHHSPPMTPVAALASFSPAAFSPIVDPRV